MIGVGRVAAATFIAAATLTVGAGEVSAHPFGDPQSLTLTADGSQVQVRWTAPPDDLLVLGGAVGALPERRELIFDVTPGEAPEPVGDTDADRLMASADLARYLEQNVAVRQDGVGCAADVRLDDLLDDGALLTFTCPAEVEQVDIEVSILTDVHEAYRTVALGDGSTSPDRTLYTIDDDVHAWQFGAGPSTGSAAPWLVAGAAVLSAAALALLFVIRRWPHVSS